MAWTPLWFGKHRGKTLPQVLFSDPDWFFWAVENNVFEDKGVLAKEAEEIDFKARHIRIPNEEGEDLVAEYLIHPSTGKFGDMNVVLRSQPLHEGASPAHRKDVIDLSFPRQIAPYDKLGCKNLLSSVKYYLFGCSSYRMTRTRCEAFFDDDTKFVL
ncbi:MAG: hypothetical protein ACE5Z5_11215 [Candidatus Bathyarchaeia archaeon]